MKALYIWTSIIILVICIIYCYGKETYCGDKLTETMQKFCKTYYVPLDRRRKRQIVQDCCKNNCSLDYMMENYCASYDRNEVLKYTLITTTGNGGASTTEYVTEQRRRRRRRRVL